MHITSSLILIYNAAGERTWKLTGEDQEMLINGKTTVNMVNFSKTLYDGSYMVMTNQEYTKHYFIEGERVCSKLGTGFEYALYSPLDKPIAAIEGSVDDIPGNLWTMVSRGIKCVDYPGEVYIEQSLTPAENDGNEFESDQYFYHPDHLGSSSFITDATGRVNQHLQYLPFGETYVDQRADKYENIRYKFSGKEKDDETGYDYFGARYYNSELSVWLSVDPLASKYPSLSPYNYCTNNPVMNIDPNGDTTMFFNRRGNYLGQVNDTRENQVHFISSAKYLASMALKKIKGSSNNETADAMRNASDAFIGKKGMDKLEAIFEKSKNEKLERGGVWVLNPLSRELSPVDLSDKVTRDGNSIDIGQVVQAAYNVNLDIAGVFHTHWQSDPHASNPTSCSYDIWGNLSFNDYQPDLYNTQGLNGMGGNAASIISGNYLNIYGTLYQPTADNALGQTSKIFNYSTNKSAKGKLISKNFFK